MVQAQIFINKNEFLGGQPLYEFIMQFLIKHQVKSATAFNGSLGYLQGSHLSRPNDLFSFDEVPLLITFIDSEEKIKEVLKSLRTVTQSGYVIVHDVKEWSE
ncbi:MULTISPECIES: DUF190 domain-containing protein [Olivibacter]|uniref:DUF190 domain-containing protein n=1 Tax=Olivibacter oleidegradans TaxID=760123 RepID=A0ABV6HJW0_9SPHI|nr:DUF190 domain-containing protein [Olivibacter jilunii]